MKAVIQKNPMNGLEELYNKSTFHIHINQVVQHFIQHIVLLVYFSNDTRQAERKIGRVITSMEREKLCMNS